jgi:hypothetical protein
MLVVIRYVNFFILNPSVYAECLMFQLQYDFVFLLYIVLYVIYCYIII